MPRLTNFPNGISSFFVDSNSEAREANYQVINVVDSGKTFTSKLDGIVFTLPRIDAGVGTGNTITFVNLSEDGQAAFNISPDPIDGIHYRNNNSDDKDLINTKATSKKGDFVTLSSANGIISWQVVAVRGIWEKEA